MPVTLLWDGEALPVTHMFDDENDEVGEWADAHTFVAGPRADGSWLAGRAADFRDVKPN